MNSASTNRGFGSTLGLIGALGVKNFRVRFRGARLGPLWVVVQPVIQGSVIAFVFSRVAPRLTTINYPLFVLSGILPWAMTTRAILAGTTSVLDNAPLVKKVAMQKAILPLSAMGAAVAASGIGVLLLIPFSVWVVGPTRLLLLPLAIAVNLLLVVPAGVLFAALYVRHRDLRFAIESAIVIAFYASPIIYPSGRLGPAMADLQRWNPITGVLSLYRAAFAGLPVDWMAVSVSAGFGAVVLAFAVIVFGRRAGEFADLV